MINTLDIKNKNKKQFKYPITLWFKYPLTLSLWSHLKIYTVYDMMVFGYGDLGRELA